MTGLHIKLPTGYMIPEEPNPYNVRGGKVNKIKRNQNLALVYSLLTDEWQTVETLFKRYQELRPSNPIKQYCLYCYCKDSIMQKEFGIEIEGLKAPLRYRIKQ